MSRKKLLRSPSALSTEMLTEGGWLVAPVEHSITSRIKRDLFGMFDLLAIRGNVTLAVQVTSKSNFADRRRKVLESPHYPAVCAAGWQVEVHGWERAKHRSGHQVRVEVLAPVSDSRAPAPALD